MIIFLCLFFLIFFGNNSLAQTIILSPEMHNRYISSKNIDQLALDQLKQNNDSENILLNELKKMSFLLQYKVATGIDPVSAYQPFATNKIEAFNLRDISAAKEKIQFGGHSENDIVLAKWSCQNYSGGDLGGSCYQFNDASGPQSSHRSGAGLLDGINLEVDSQANAPLDVIGGNTKSQDGVIYAISQFGPNTVKITPALSKKEEKLLKYRMSIGTNIANGMASHESLIYDGTDNVDLPNYYYGYLSGFTSDKESTTLTIESYYYPGAKQIGAIQNSGLWRTIKNPSPYPQAGSNSSWEQEVQSAEAGDTTLTLKGPLTLPFADRNVISGNINPCNSETGWVCFISGPGIEKNVTVKDFKMDQQTIEKPNILHPIKIVISLPIKERIKDNTKIRFSIISKSHNNLFYPGNIQGDTLDTNLFYKSKIDNKIHKTTCCYAYDSPAIFLGFVTKSFNEYHLHTNNNWAKNVATRAHDNEYDFWMYADHEGELESRGSTYVWQGNHRLSTGSWMSRWAGFNLMPTGLWVDGVTAGGMILRTDAGDWLYKQIGLQQHTIGIQRPISMLGSGGSSTHFGQLGFYSSEDGSQNGSFHLGLTSSPNSLQYNNNPLCEKNDIVPENVQGCSLGGQIIFDPPNHLGGVALGVGQGSGTRVGLIVDTSGKVKIPTSLNLDKKSSLSFTISSSNSSSISLSTSKNGNLIENRSGKADGGFVPSLYRYATLPQHSDEGTILYCTDCYSSLRNIKNINTGIIVTWNGKNWVDGVGNPALH